MNFTINKYIVSLFLIVSFISNNANSAVLATGTRNVEYNGKVVCSISGDEQWNSVNVSYESYHTTFRCKFSGDLFYGGCSISGTQYVYLTNSGGSNDKFITTTGSNCYGEGTTVYISGNSSGGGGSCSTYSSGDEMQSGCPCNGGANNQLANIEESSSPSQYCCSSDSDFYTGGVYSSAGCKSCGEAAYFDYSSSVMDCVPYTNAIASNSPIGKSYTNAYVQPYKCPDGTTANHSTKSCDTETTETSLVFGPWGNCNCSDANSDNYKTQTRTCNINSETCGSPFDSYKTRACNCGTSSGGGYIFRWNDFDIDVTGTVDF